MENLKDKKWPAGLTEDERFQGERIKIFLKKRAGYEKSAFVSEGHTEVRRLGPVAFTKPIPPEESAITCLLRHSNGKIYGGTSGKKAHLFFYDPSPDADTVVDIDIVGKNTKVTSLVSEENGRIFGGTQDNEGAGSMFVYSPCEVLLEKAQVVGKSIREVFDMPAEDQMFHSIVDPTHSVGKIEFLEPPVAGEGITSLAIDRGRGLLYGVTAKSGFLFVYDIKNSEVVVKGKIDETGEFTKKIVVDNNGIVYGACGNGKIVRYDPERGVIEKLNMYAPSLKGREIYNCVDCWAADEKTNIIYGGTVDGILFVLYPEEEKIICLGKPLDQTRIRALTVGKDGRVFGIGGEHGKCCHLFVYEPETRQLRDLGVLLATVETPWYGYEFEAGVTGRDGEIYFGESDRISHLFIYFPAIEGRQKSSE